MTEPNEPRDPIERIEAALARLGEEHEPPAGWEARVLAATAPPRRRPWWWFAAPGALAAATVVVIVLALPRKPAALGVAYDVAAGPVKVRGETAIGKTSGEANLGDTFRVRVTGGHRREIWVYHNDHTLVVRCPGGPGCTDDGDALRLDLPIDRIGVFQIVSLDATGDLAPPKGEFDRDVADAERQSATISQYKLTVR